MEKVKKDMPIEGAVLHATIVTADMGTDILQSAISTKDMMARFVLGDGLAFIDTVTIDGKDVREALPRPDMFGNTILALMSILDTMSPDTKLSLKIVEKAVLTEAAD